VVVEVLAHGHALCDLPAVGEHGVALAVHGRRGGLVRHGHGLHYGVDESDGGLEPGGLGSHGQPLGDQVPRGAVEALDDLDERVAEVAAAAQGVDRLLGVAGGQSGLLEHRHVAEHEVLRSEHAGDIGVGEGLVGLDDDGAVGCAHLAAFVAQRLAHRLPEAGRVDKLDLAAAFGGLVVVEDPDVGCDAGAVEHLGRQGDDRVDEVLVEQPLADRVGPGVGVEQRRCVGDHGGAPAGGAELRRAVAQEQHLAVGLAGQPVAEPGAGRLGLLADRLLLDLPVAAERRVGQHVVEGLVVVEVGDERVALADRVRAPALDQQVGLAEGVGGVHQLLAVDGDLDVGVQLLERVLGDQQHAAGTGGGVVDGAQRVLPGQGVLVGREQHVDHELDRVAGGVERTGGLPLLVEGAVHDVLEDVAHGGVFDVGGAERQRREVLDDGVEPVRGGEFGDELGEVEGRPDVRDVLREASDVAQQRLVDVVVDRGDRGQVEGRDVVEA